jgi:hypothetical protein
MMHSLQLRKGGILMVREWDSEAHDYVEEQVIEDEIQYCLDDRICFEKGVALRDIFLLMSRHVSMFSVISGCPFLDEMIEDAFKPPKRSADKEGMSILQLGRKAFIDDYNDDSILNFHFDLYGIGEHDAYAVEFSPIYELTLYPVILNDKLNIEGQESDAPLLSVRMPFTLAEMIKGIVGELSFAGPPDIKAYALDGLKMQAEGVIENGHKTLTTEEVEQKLNERIKADKKPCRICGEDSRSPSFNKPPDICDRCFRNIKEN